MQQRAIQNRILPHRKRMHLRIQRAALVPQTIAVRIHTAVAVLIIIIIIIVMTILILGLPPS